MRGILLALSWHRSRHPPTGHLSICDFTSSIALKIAALLSTSQQDLPEVMMQVGAWPMVPRLDGNLCAWARVRRRPFANEPDIEQSQNSRQLIIDMLSKMILHPGEGGPEIMELSRFWHPKMNWKARLVNARIDGFQPTNSLNAMPIVATK